MTTIADAGQGRLVTGGVDTRAEVHVAGVADQAGRVLGTAEFPATTAGYAAALAWMRGHGELRPHQPGRGRQGRHGGPSPPPPGADRRDHPAGHRAGNPRRARGPGRIPGPQGRGHPGRRRAAGHAGDNPRRLRTDASFAALCGASPVDASSGKQHRHRLNRGGDRQANSALWRIVFTRMATDPRTMAYLARRTAEGKTTKEIIRCLNRYLAREVYKALTGPHPAVAQHPHQKSSMIT